MPLGANIIAGGFWIIFIDNLLPLIMAESLGKNIIKSNKSNPKLAYENYFYNYVKISVGRIMWRCNKRGCCSILKTTLNYVFTELSMPNNMPDEIKFNRVLLAEKAKEGAINTQEAARNILHTVSKGFDVLVDVKIKQMRKIVLEKRKK